MSLYLNTGLQSCSHLFTFLHGYIHILYIHTYIVYDGGSIYYLHLNPAMINKHDIFSMNFPMNQPDNNNQNNFFLIYLPLLIECYFYRHSLRNICEHAAAVIFALNDSLSNHLYLDDEEMPLFCCLDFVVAFLLIFTHQ